MTIALLATSQHACPPVTVLIGMDEWNIRNMNRICGGDPENKIHMLLDYSDRPGDVADPWYTGNFEATWRDVLEGCEGILAKY